MDRFVRSLPDGYDTVIDEEGSNVSAGEKQLITIARAFLAEPSLLILDEATSALDAESEARIHAAVQSLRGEMTVLIISHRAAMLQGLDEIYTMDGGRLLAPTRPSVPPLPTG